MTAPDIIRDLQARINALEGRGSSESLEANRELRERKTAAGEFGLEKGSGRLSDPAGSRGGDSHCDGDAAFKKIVALLNASDKSEQCLRKRLTAADYSQDAIETAISRAKEFGFIDDARFSEVLVRSRAAQGKGLQGIQRELTENGIDPDGLDPELFAEFDDDAEIERALSTLRRKPPRSKNLRQSAYRKLVQKGFSSTVASSASRVWCEEQQSKAIG